ncbi:hypothetical protein MA16_Dca023095 [Dendrobium catenatum]|uniref:Uncharacterized protein n=1 Tax=Dendrobium catenatum TaxID=906689 RepID=A0A2I0X0G9_9ASPA|nr:hypothetical protein MA16_Dca023095 [Dendrobium catenatum]
MSAPSKASTLSTLPSPPATYFVLSTYPGSSPSIFYSALLPLSSSKKLLELYWLWRIFLAFSSQWVISSARDLRFGLRSVPLVEDLYIYHGKIISLGYHMLFSSDRGRRTVQDREERRWPGTC